MLDIAYQQTKRLWNRQIFIDGVKLVERYYSVTKQVEQAMRFSPSVRCLVNNMTSAECDPMTVAVICCISTSYRANQ